MTSTGAGYKRHKSRQDLATPREFLDAVERRFGNISLDLAANRENHVCPNWHGPGGDRENTFDAYWSRLYGNLWLNPEFEHTPKYARKMALECKNRDAFSFLLAPASVGSNWFNDYVASESYVLFLTDRITFVGESKKYPKDLILAVYGFGLVGRDSWHWDVSVKKRGKKA